MDRLRHLLDAVLPPRCLACGTVDVVTASAAQDVCPVCREHFHDARPLGAYVYVGPVAELLTRAKYSRDLATARGLARIFAESIDVDGAIDAVTYVPAHWWRALQRGFDLPALLADALAERCGVPLVELLRVTRRDASLAASGSVDERRALVDGRFAVSKQAEHWRGKRIVIVDDVHTTGATLSAAVGVLERAGVIAVPRVLAVTPGPDGTAPTQLTTTTTA